MLYLVSNSFWRVSVSKPSPSSLFIHRLFFNPAPPLICEPLQGASLLMLLFGSGEYFWRKSHICSHFSSPCQLAQMDPSRLLFWTKLSEKQFLDPKEPQLLRLHGVLCIKHFIVQILSDFCELVFSADTTSAVDAKIWMWYFKSGSTSAKERAIINTLLLLAP